MTILEPKDPNAVVDYQIDWSEWLGTDTIATSTWVVSAGITNVTDSHTNTGTTIWLSGGTDGTAYDLTNHITTAGGRQEDRTITVPVANK